MTKAQKREKERQMEIEQKNDSVFCPLPDGKIKMDKMKNSIKIIKHTEHRTTKGN